MSENEFIELYELQPNTAILEPWDEFKDGIIGVTDDGHVVYGYYHLIDALSKVYGNDEYAIDWIDYNTIPTIKNMPKEGRPIIVYEI